MLCEWCLKVVVECACCAGQAGGCSCGMPICGRCAEALCADVEPAVPSLVAAAR